MKKTVFKYVKFFTYVDYGYYFFYIFIFNFKVHPVGWCATKGKPLIPPKTIQVII